MIIAMNRRWFVIVLLILLALLGWRKYGYLLQSAQNLAPRTSSLPDASLAPATVSTDSELGYVHLPPGFHLSYFAKGVPGARSLTVGAEGTVYVGTRNQGVVYALPDADHDGRADSRYIVASKLNSPNGVAYTNGDLYVAEISRIIKFPDIAHSYAQKPPFSIVYDQLPKDTHHGWKYLAVGPDNRLYVPIGAPCNACERADPYAALARLDLDGSNFAVIARGIRNTVGFAWNPADDSLWFTDNGRDNLGDDVPGDELNRLSPKGANFGFPYCHAGTILDPQFGQGKDCTDYVSPAQVLGPHVAALGMKFYQGSMFPPEYRGKVFIAEHGSWNRQTPIGYRVSTVDINGDSASNYQTFADGWLGANGKASGRPVDVLELPDGSLLISDDFAGAVYRITHD